MLIAVNKFIPSFIIISAHFRSLLQFSDSVGRAIRSAALEQDPHAGSSRVAQCRRRVMTR